MIIRVIYLLAVVAGVVFWNTGHIPIEDLLICLALVPALYVFMVVVEKAADLVAYPLGLLLRTPMERAAARAAKRAFR